MLESNAKLCIKVIGLMTDRLSDLHFRIGELQTQSVEQRLAYALISLSRAATDEEKRAGASGFR